MARTEHSTLRVAVAAAPFLLADSLRALLEDVGVDATLLTGPSTEHFDVAVVGPDADPVDAEILIVLDSDESGRASGTVKDASGDPVTLLDDLPAIIEFIRSLAR